MEIGRFCHDGEHESGQYLTTKEKYTQGNMGVPRWGNKKSDKPCGNTGPTQVYGTRCEKLQRSRQ
jgi:hypothetical protein